jgi:hypothetical protein
MTAKFKITSYITPARIVIQERRRIFARHRLADKLVKVELVLSDNLEYEEHKIEHGESKVLFKPRVYKLLTLPQQSAGYMSLGGAPQVGNYPLHHYLCSVFVSRKTSPGRLEGFNVLCAAVDWVTRAAKEDGSRGITVLCCVERALVSAEVSNVEAVLWRRDSEICWQPKQVDSWSVDEVRIKTSVSLQNFLGRDYHKLLIELDRKGTKGHKDH